MAARIFMGPMETSKVFGVDDAVYARLTAERFEFDEVAYLDAFGDVGLGGGIVLVGAGGVGDYGGVELFGELAAEGGHAAVGVAGDLLVRAPCRRWL